LPTPELTDVTLDRLTADVSVFQRRKGHRFSSDDVITAWVALQVCATPERVLDLGCGLGSVLLHVAWSVPTAHLVGVEVQDVSFELLRRNVDHNHLGHRVSIRHGDFRDADVMADLGGPFDLVTGTPPYFPHGTATYASDDQRARARMETRGGLEAYVRTGALHLSRGGWLVVCGDADAQDRLHSVAAQVNMEVGAQVVVIPREHRSPLFTVWGLRHTTGDTHSETPVLERTLTLRDANGERTTDAMMVRAFSGFPERVYHQPLP
jgi:tRNA1Val (adenine37-N6)-methyltransferase